MLRDAAASGNKKAVVKNQLALGCLSIISGLILHLNYIVLPEAIAQKGVVYAFTIFGVLAATFSLLILYFIKSFLTVKTKSAGNVMVTSKSLQY